MMATWTLEELTARMRAVLSTTGLASDAATANGQISDVPNARTVRYYTTIGVLDRPQQRGRVALYGRRHLEQLVAIKRLQAQGKTLADVQARVAGLDDDALSKLAGVDDATLELHGPSEKPADDRRGGSFWAVEPDEPVPPSPSAASAQVLAGIQLDDGVTLAFPAARTVNDDDTKALRAALQDVVEILRARGLL